MAKQQTDDSRVNRFQDDTQQKLTTILTEKRQAGRFEIIELPPEPLGTTDANELAVKATVGTYEIWIYPDGANVLGGTDKRFEISDYGSLDDLQGAFLEFVADLLQITCSFCGTDVASDDPDRAVAGPGVFICRDCIGLCIEIMARQAPEWLSQKVKEATEPKKEQP